MNSYSYYLRESLGLENFIFPRSYNDTPMAVEPLAIYIEGNSLSSGEEELLKKILAALSFHIPSHYFIAEGAEFVPAGQVSICFVKSPADNRIGKTELINGKRVYFTHHLQAMIQNPSYKKAVWSHLQAAKPLLE